MNCPRLFVEREFNIVFVKIGILRDKESAPAGLVPAPG